MVLAVVWAIAATYVALRDAAVAQITDAALFKAAAILGAFVLFGSLVWMREAQRRRERQIDAEFELERALTDVRSNRK
jgi:predicted anti-sigma-YlaC factor YlaD